jgi:hypothetical protein
VTINVPLLRKELDFVTAHPDLHRQNLWAHHGSCGTTACLAGWTVLHAGFETEGTYGSQYHVRSATTLQRVGSTFIPTVASKLLGLTWQQGEFLFYSANTVADMWLLASVFTDGEIEVPPKFDDQACPRAQAMIVRYRAQSRAARRTRHDPSIDGVANV